MTLDKKLSETINRLTKWRSVFAGWQLGTRSSHDPECQAVRDHREGTIILRVETTAITKVLVDKGICSVEDLQKAMIEEAELLNKDYEKKFPGMKATDYGIDYDIKKAAETMKGWNP